MAGGASNTKRTRSAGEYDIFPPSSTLTPSARPWVAPPPQHQEKMSLALVHDEDLQNDSEPEVYEAEKRKSDERQARIASKVLNDFRAHFNIKTPLNTSPIDNSNIDGHDLRASTIAETNSSIEDGDPQAPAKKRAKHGERERAETPAARTAQARRDATIRIQNELEAVMPLKHLQAKEEYKKGLDPRARAMFAATEYIKHLRDENEELSDAYHSLVPTKEKLSVIGRRPRRQYQGYYPLPQLPDQEANTQQIRMLRAVAVNLIRVTQGREEINGRKGMDEDVLDEDLADRLGEISLNMIEVVDEIMAREDARHQESDDSEV